MSSWCSEPVASSRLCAARRVEQAGASESRRTRSKTSASPCRRWTGSGPSSRLTAARNRAAALENEADETEALAMAKFEAALGLEPPAPLPDRPVFTASFKDLNRWSHEAILRQINERGAAHTSPYPTVQLRDVIADLENGWSPRCHDRPAEPNEWGVLKLGAVSFGVFN